jgi:membrane-bound ClpP family serine protease
VPETELFWGIVLLVGALGLLVLEIFVPSMGLISIVGVTLAIVGLVLLYRYDPVIGMIGTAAMVLMGPMVVVFGLKVFPHTPIGRTMLYGGKTEEELEQEAALARAEADKRLALIGMEGEALTVLRPVGAVRIEGKRYDALAELGMIQPGTRVKVTAVDGTRVKVRQV